MTTFPSPNQNRLLELEQSLQHQRKTVSRKPRHSVPSSQKQEKSPQYHRLTSPFKSTSSIPKKRQKKSLNQGEWQHLAQQLRKDRKETRIPVYEELPEIQFATASDSENFSAKASISSPKLQTKLPNNPESWQGMARVLKERKAKLSQEQSLALKRNYPRKIDKQNSPEIIHSKNRTSSESNHCKPSFLQLNSQNNLEKKQIYSLIETQIFDDNQPIKICFASSQDFTEIIPSFEIEIESFEEFSKQQLKKEIIEIKTNSNSSIIAVEVFENQSNGKLETINAVPSDVHNEIASESVDETIDNYQDFWDWIAKLIAINHLILGKIQLQASLNSLEKTVNRILSKIIFWNSFQSKIFQFSYLLPGIRAPPFKLSNR